MDNIQIINYVDCSAEQQKEIYQLRNLPEIRQWMTNPEPIMWVSHLEFLNILKNDANRKYYAIYKNGELVGTYNLTRVSGSRWERGIITSPQFQGTGSTAIYEKIILGELSKEEFSIIEAKVKLDNLRSIKYHLKAGFVETHRDNEYVYFELETNKIPSFGEEIIL